jgi:hypothetical protein
MTLACTLTTAERRERRAFVRARLLPRIRSVEETASGYVLFFDRADGELQTIATFIELESRCCAFLTFTVRLEAAAERIALTLEGPEGAKELLRPMVEGRP